MKAQFKTANYLDPILLLEYKIHAKPDIVYDAWTNLEVFQKWFCPTGFSVAIAEMDLKVGGYFRIHMKSPEDQIYPTKGEYLVLEKPNRIVYKDSWDDNRENNEPTVAEIIFEAAADQTVMKLYYSFATKEQKETMLSSGIEQGWKMFLDNLKELLKK
ncbi:MULTISPECIES: SRPBCC family protein [unclassified Flavobacterium]|uniref:SRPBCC family protein n=1 Tax=unclassified Flavobacterium TaxID=196869 RepID=UPI003F8F9131